MPKTLKRKNATAIQLEVDSILTQMKTTPADSEEYSKLAKNLDLLTKIDHNTDDHISKEVLATIAANLAGIVLILQHENAHALTSKAISFVSKVKL